MKRSICSVMMLVLLGVSAPGAHAQRAAPRSGVEAFAIEAAGGAVGAAAGFGAAMLFTDRDGCGDDLTCVLDKVAFVGVLATVGSAAGTYFTGRAFDTEPNALGAVLGAVVGAAAAIGVDHLLTEELNTNASEGTRFGAFALTQGIVTAPGSRLAAAAS